MRGASISHYTILDELGRGGMGVVYLARDETLGREVAIKVLSPTLVRDTVARWRFHREARAVASLSHPNIAAIFDAGVFDDQPFLVFQYVDGVELDTYARDRDLSIPDRVGICTPVADALDHAHSKAIIHRDVKPSNILVTPDGTARILDFGLAKPRDTKNLTRSGATLGTVAYMSPEQVRGETLDHRSDLWSFGVVLYELVYGEQPFRGDYEAAVSYAVVNEDPRFPDSVEVPGELVTLLGDLLQKDPEDRPESAGEITGRLLTVTEGAATPSVETWSTGQRGVRRRVAPRLRLARRIRRLAVPVLAFSVLVCALLVYMLIAFGVPWTDTGSAPNVPAVAVMPFVDLGPDQEYVYLGEGIAEDLSSALVQIDGVRVSGRGSTAYLSGQGLSVREVGTRLSVDRVIQGSVRVIGDRLRVTVELSDAQSGFRVWGDTYNAVFEDVLSVQDRLVRSIVLEVSESLGADVPEYLGIRGGTRDREAYDAYQQGIYHRVRLQAEMAIEDFARALRLDPDFALAHAWMSIARSQMVDFGVLPPTEAVSDMELHAQEAMRLEPALPIGEAAISRVEALRLRFDEALRHARRAEQLEPMGTSASWSARVASLVALGRLEEAREAVRTELRRDPLSIATAQYAALILTNLGNLDEAATVVDSALVRAPDDPFMALRRADLVARRGDPGAAAEMLRPLRNDGPTFTLFHGFFLALSGDTDGLEESLADLDRRSESTYVSPFARATLHAYAGNDERALELYGDALERYDAWLPFAGFVAPPAELRTRDAYQVFLDGIVPDSPWKSAEYDTFGRLANVDHFDR